VAHIGIFDIGLLKVERGLVTFINVVPTFACFVVACKALGPLNEPHALHCVVLGPRFRIYAVFHPDSCPVRVRSNKWLGLDIQVVLMDGPVL